MVTPRTGEMPEIESLDAARASPGRSLDRGPRHPEPRLCGFAFVTSEGAKEIVNMNILVAIVAIVAVILLFTGGFVQSLNFLLWVGLVLAVIAVIVFLTRYIGGRKTV